MVSVALVCHPRCRRHLASDFCRWFVLLSAGRRRGLSTCGLYGRTGEARAELRCSGVYRGQAQGGGLREGGWRQQLHGNQSQMNRDPSLIPRLCETQWRPTTHLLPRKLCNNPPLSTGFHLAYDDSLPLISSDLSHIMYRSMPGLPPHAGPPPWDAPSHAVIWENWYFSGSEHDPLDNVKEIIWISCLRCCTWALKHAVLTSDPCFCCFHCGLTQFARHLLYIRLL